MRNVTPASQHMGVLYYSGMTRHVLQGAIQRLLYLPIVYQYTVYSFC